MKTRRLSTMLVAVAALSLIGAACTGNDGSTTAAPVESSMATQPDTSTMTIPEIVAENPDFSTLLAAVGAAKLGDTLSSEGPFTVFAPTDEAFAALPEGTLDALIKPKNRDRLQAILTYHVLADDVMASNVRPGMVPTVNGETFKVSTDGGAVTITDGQGNEAMLTTTDVLASNGVIHVIDGVLLPPSE